VSGHWRVLVTFEHEVDAERVLKCLKDAGEVHEAGGSLSMPDGNRAIWVYVADSAATGPVAAAVRRGTVAAAVKPLSVRVDEWVPEERRWSSDPYPGRRAAGGAGMDSIDVTNLIMDVFGGISWP
jgi:hypothetical protein